MRNIREYVSDQHSVMRTVIDELIFENPTDLKQLQSTLNVKVLAERFDRMFLVDEYGNLYADTFAVYDVEHNYFSEYFENNPQTEFVRRYDDNKRYHEFNKEYLLYGINLADEPVELAGMKFVAFVALTDISEIQSRMRITSFENKGYSSVINTNGDYIVRDDSSAALNRIPNFFELLSSSEVQKPYTKDDIIIKISQRENVSFNIIRENGSKKFVSIKPILDSNWLFVFSIDQSVFEQQANTFMLISMLITGIMLVIFTAALIVFYFMRKKVNTLYSSFVDGVYNRSYYIDRLAKENVTALAIVDMDHLKHINDNYGHPAGDSAIMATANVIRRNVGGNAVIVRYGGDEFIVAFKSRLTYDEFVDCLENILNEVREETLDEYPDVKITVSGGGYYCSGKADSLFKSADVLLYQAKAERNRIVTAEADETETVI